MWYLISIIIITVVVTHLLKKRKRVESFNSQITSITEINNTITFIYSESAEIDSDWNFINFRRLVNIKVVVDFVNKGFYLTENGNNYKWLITSEISTLLQNSVQNIDFTVTNDDGVRYEIMIRGTSKIIIYGEFDQIKMIYAKEGVLQDEHEDALIIKKRF